MISQTTEYALRAIVDLSFHAGASRTTQQIAEATQVPAGYLSKVLKELSRQGVVRAQRGLHGGFTLEIDPEELTLYDVIAAVDPPKRIHECPLKLEAHRHNLCPLHQRLDDALAMIEKVFRETTIAEVTADPTRVPLGRRSKRGAELTISGGLAPIASNSRPKKGKGSAKGAGGRGGRKR
ncbi:MAG: Rrf2 family transcriptional regulator [Phycisphaeraceae bacterium]|nr:MAG: Rrf2 family transcriptional regulator [Phycisphaeraceae bacterium]